MTLKFKQTTTVSLRLRFILSSLLAATLLAAPLPSSYAFRAETGRTPPPKSPTTVRGKLVRQMKGGQRPAAYVPITLLSSDKSQRTVPVYTDSRGMFYIYSPSGKYILEIWGNEKQVLMSFYLDVPDAPYFDLAPIAIP